jgi:hypothetical protein
MQEMHEHRILFVGLGDLGAQIFDMLVRVPGKHLFLVGGRNLDYLHQRTNLSILAAIHQGSYSEVICTSMDLWNIEQTAQTISQFQPDLIFCAATMQRWGVISKLPKPVSERLYTAQMGPWLPIHLTLVYKLMQAVKQTGLKVKVINATYPDVVNPVLDKVGLAPTTGIGDLANNIPALRKSVAITLDYPLEQVDVRFFAQRYLSYRISRVGNAGDAPFHLTALVDGQDVTHLLNMATIFSLLPTRFKRSAGHLMTATSATIVFEEMVSSTNKVIHAPGPCGLPGGYPVRVNERGLEVILPDNLTLENAIYLNQECMRLDGIEHIDVNGTVYFTSREMAILKEFLGYDCQCMLLVETEEWAKELQAKYVSFASKYSPYGC